MAIQSIVNVNNGQVFSPPSNDVATTQRAVASSQPAAAQQPQQPQQPQASKPAVAPSAQEVQQAADIINKALQRLNSSSLEFSVDHDSGRTIVRVVDIATKDVIRQIPNEEALAISKSLDSLQGLLIQHKV